MTSCIHVTKAVKASPGMRELIKLAQAKGWVVVSYSNGHFRIKWPPTGDVLTMPSSPSDIRSSRNAEANLARFSGPLREKNGNGKTKSEKAAATKRKRLQADAHARKLEAKRASRIVSIPLPSGLADNA